MRGQASKERDSETGLHYYGARYYDSKLGIWLSVDPLLDKYPGLSPYNFCMNNPMNAVDPDGRNPFVITEGAKALFVATVVLTVATLHTAKYATDRSYRESVNKTGQSTMSVLQQALDKLGGVITKPNYSEDKQDDKSSSTGESKSIDWGNAPPASPEELGEEWTETTSDKNKGGNSREFTNKETGETVRYDKGTPDAKGYKRKDHWHRNNPNTKGKHDKYLDKNGNPCKRGSQESHIVVK